MQRLLSELHLTSHHLPRLSLPSFLRPMCLGSSQCPVMPESPPSSAQHALIRTGLHTGALWDPHPCPWVWGPPSSSAQHLQSLPQRCYGSTQLHLCYSSCGALTGRSHRRKVPQQINFLRKKKNIAQAKHCPSMKLKY